MIAEQNTNLLAEYLAAKIPHRHLGGGDRACSGERCIQAAHVREHANIDRRLPQLLRPRHERPHRRAPNERDELASSHGCPPHSITSSAQRSSSWTNPDSSRHNALGYVRIYAISVR